MLISSLKLIGHRHLNPIFVSICGLLQAISVVFKSMKGKKKFYKVTMKDVKNEFGIKSEKTMIFSQQEFERERAISGNLKRIATNQRNLDDLMECEQILTEDDTQPTTPPEERKKKQIKIKHEEITSPDHKGETGSNEEAEDED